MERKIVRLAKIPRTEIVTELIEQWSTIRCLIQQARKIIVVYSAMMLLAK